MKTTFAWICINLLGVAFAGNFSNLPGILQAKIIAQLPDEDSYMRFSAISKTHLDDVTSALPLSKFLYDRYGPTGLTRAIQRRMSVSVIRNLLRYYGAEHVLLQPALLDACRSPDVVEVLPIMLDYLESLPTATIQTLIFSTDLAQTQPLTTLFSSEVVSDEEPLYSWIDRLLRLGARFYTTNAHGNVMEYQPVNFVVQRRFTGIIERFPDYIAFRPHHITTAISSQYIKLADYIWFRLSQETRQRFGRRELLRAAIYNDLVTARFLMDRGIDPNAYPHHSETPLQIAALSKNLAMIELLLEFNADVGEGRALGAAVESNSLLIAETLLKAGASQFITRPKSTLQMYAIFVAVIKGSLAMLQLLLKYGADPNLIEGKVLLRAAETNFYQAIPVLIEAGLDLHQPCILFDRINESTLGVQAIRKALQFGHSAFFMNLYPIVAEGHSAIPSSLLLEAASSPVNSQLMLFLLQQMSDVDQVLLDQALMAAIQQKQPYKTRVLLQHGASATVNQSRPLYMAKYILRHRGIEDELVNAGAMVVDFFGQALEHAIHDVSLHVIEEIVTRTSVELNPEQSENMPLLLALDLSLHESLEVLKLLLRHGALAHWQESLALRQEARKGGRAPIMELLITHGADIHAVRDEALRMSVHKGNDEAVEFLLNFGADVDVVRFMPMQRLSQRVQNLLTNISAVMED